VYLSKKLKFFYVSVKRHSIFAPYIGMKNFYFNLLTVLAFALQLACCGDICPSRYNLELPNPPESWVSLLGQPCWRIEWIDQNGENRTAELKPGQNLEIELQVTCINPVIALPYWTEHNLPPGVFMPAGALFPFDVEKDAIRLSWSAGYDVIFYRELAIFANIDKNPTKIPANFDWIRFRELFQSDDLGEAVRKDPWLVNWSFVAEKTISGNFDKRRLVPEKTEQKTIPVPYGFWYGTSSLADPLFFENNAVVSFPVRPGVNVWVSSNGILQVNGNVWMLTKIK
jgi:hypothetical protein